MFAWVPSDGSTVSRLAQNWQCPCSCRWQPLASVESIGGGHQRARGCRGNLKVHPIYMCIGDCDFLLVKVTRGAFDILGLVKRLSFKAFGNQNNKSLPVVVEGIDFAIRYSATNGMNLVMVGSNRTAVVFFPPFALIFLNCS